MSDGGKIGDMAGAGNGDDILFDNTNRRIDTNIDGGRILSVGNAIVGINTTPVSNTALTVAGEISASGFITTNSNITSSGYVEAKGGQIWVGQSDNSDCILFRNHTQTALSIGQADDNGVIYMDISPGSVLLSGGASQYLDIQGTTDATNYLSVYCINIYC